VLVGAVECNEVAIFQFWRFPQARSKDRSLVALDRSYAAPTQGVVFIYSGGIDRAIVACAVHVLMRGK
jgi:hypothetical protein